MRQKTKKERTFNRELYYQKETKVDEYGESYEVVIYPFRGRVAEFRFLYPHGRIVNEIVTEKSSSNFTVYKCSIYLDKTDTLPVAVATATRDLDASTDFGRRFYECAETAAVVRALRLLGIGLDFAEDDPTIPEQIVLKSPVEKTSNTRQHKVIRVAKKVVKPDSETVAENEECQKKETDAVEETVDQTEDKKPEAVENKEIKTEENSDAENMVQCESVEESTDEQLNDDELLNVLITTTKSKALRGKTFAEAILMAKDMNAFKHFLSDLTKKGCDSEKKAAEMLLRTQF